MNREQSLAFLKKCEELRATALEAGQSEEEAHEAAKAKWNNWAGQLINEKIDLQKADKWKVRTKYDPSIPLTVYEGKNEETTAWLEKAQVDLSFLVFTVTNISIQDKAELNKHQTKADATTFTGSQFNMSGYIFPDLAFFNGSSFYCKTNFNKTQFMGFVGFDSVHFLANAEFNRAIFSEKAWFDEAIFQKAGRFNRAEFSEKTYFKQTKFEGDAVFRNTVFKHEIRFTDAEFKNLANFREAKFFKYAKFGQASFYSFATFLRAEFYDYANFSALRCERALEMADVKFTERVPDFIQADFQAPPRLDNMIVPERSFWKSIFGKADPEAIAKYRALRTFAIASHDYERERKFYKGELRCKRNAEQKIYHPSWWFSLLYDIFSDFGHAVLRPLVLWFLLIPIFASGYYHYSLASCKDGFFRSLYLAAKNSLIVGSNRESELEKAYSCLYGVKNGIANVPVEVGFFGVGHMLFSAVFIFLFLLGLRNLFKIK